MLRPIRFALVMGSGAGPIGILTSHFDVIAIAYSEPILASRKGALLS